MIPVGATALMGRAPSNFGERGDKLYYGPRKLLRLVVIFAVQYDSPVCLFNPAFRGCQNPMNGLCTMGSLKRFPQT